MIEVEIEESVFGGKGIKLCLGDNQFHHLPAEVSFELEEKLARENLKLRDALVSKGDGQ